MIIIKGSLIITINLATTIIKMVKRLTTTTLIITITLIIITLTINNPINKKEYMKFKKNNQTQTTSKEKIE